MAEKVLTRDAGACRCCGFASKKFQRVIPRDGAKGETVDQLITVCGFCEACFSLEKTGMIGAGVLIWLPEIEQAELNHLARALYIARDSGESLAARAARALEVLTARRAEARKRLGTDDPAVLATALLESVDDKFYQARQVKLEGIRLLPLDRAMARQGGADVNVFPQMMAYWTSADGPFARLPVSSWAGMFENVTRRVGA